MNFIIDGLIFFFIITMAIRGFFRGFIEEFGQMIGLIISSLISLTQFYKISNYLSKMLFLEQWLSNTFSFIIIFSISLMIIRIIIKTIHIIFLSNYNQWMNKFLGILFGGIKGSIIITVFIWFIAILPLTKWTSIIEENSKFAKVSNDIGLLIIDIFNWNDSLIKTESYFKKITHP